MSVAQLVLLLNFAATWFMVGLIWFVQVVHYPLFAAVPVADFSNYHKRHVRLTTRVVAPVMLIELATAIALLWVRPAGVPARAAWVGLALLAIAWASTWRLQIPRHDELARCFASDVHGALCRTNWLRTAAWTARGAVMAYALSALIRPG